MVRPKIAAGVTLSAAVGMLTLGIACCLPAAAAEVPKQGDFAGKFYGHGTWKGGPSRRHARSLSCRC